nr:hypothetical protein BaRGS_019880 [Batillaria attramentaria]
MSHEIENGARKSERKQAKTACSRICAGLFLFMGWWVSTVMVFCVFIIIFLVVFIGLLRRSKWMLMVAATLSVIFMLFIWLATGVYLALSVDIIDAQQSVSQAITALNATVNISAPFSNKKYQAGNYMQQYYNLAPRPSSIQQSLSDA